MNYVHMYHHEEEKKCEKSVIFLTRKSWGKAQVCLWMFIMIKRMQHNSFQKTRLILWILQSFWPGELKFNFLSISNFPMTRGRISLEKKKKNTNILKYITRTTLLYLQHTQNSMGLWIPHKPKLHRIKYWQHVIIQKFSLQRQRCPGLSLSCSVAVVGTE